MRTHFGREARALRITRLQLELIVGSLLGDATLLPTTLGHCFRVHHGVSQAAFVDWKHGHLRRLVRTAPRQSGRGYYFRTVSHPIFSALRREFYNERQKVVPFDLLRKYLTPFAMAVWIMDDGAIDGKQLRLNTQSFTIEEAYDLARLLEQRFRTRVTVNLDKGKPRLRFASAGLGGFIASVQPFMLPEMSYKIPIL